MRLVILDNSDKVSEWAARYIMKRIHDFNPGPDKYFVLGLPTGNIYITSNKPMLQYISCFVQNDFNLFTLDNANLFHLLCN